MDKFLDWALLIAFVVLSMLACAGILQFFLVYLGVIV